MKRNQKFQSNRKSNRVPARPVATLKSIKKKVHHSELTVAQAYDIVAGYRPSNRETFDRAVKVLKEHKINKKFISLLSSMRTNNVSFNGVAPDVYAKNLQTAYIIFNNSKQWEAIALADEDVRKALSNTSIIGDNGVLTNEEKKNMDTIIASTGILRAVDAILVSPEVVNNSRENIRKMVADNTLCVIGTQRVEETSDLSKGSNFDEPVEVKGNRFLSAWNWFSGKVQKHFDEAVNSTVKEVKIIGNKCRKAAAIFLAATTMTASLVGCTSNSNPAPQKQRTEQKVIKLKTNPAPAPKQETKQEVKQEISVPTEYSDDMNLKGGAAKFKMLQEYYGERFDEAYKFFSQRDSLLVSQDGQDTLTVMQAMDQLRGHHDMKSNNKIMQKDMKNATACEDEIHENITKEDVADLFTPIPTGDRDSRTTGLSYPDCNSYKAKHVSNKKKQAPDTLQILPDTLNNKALSNDSITITDGTGEVRLNSDTTKVNAPSKALGAQYLQSNVSSDGAATDTLAIRNASLDEIVNGVKVDADKTIKVEGQRAETSADQPGNPNGVHVDYMKGDDKGLTQVVDSANISDVLGLNVDGKIKVSGNSGVGASVANAAGKQNTTSFTSGAETITFDDEADSTLVSNHVNTDSIASNFTSTTTELTDSVEIVFGTDSVEIGTPSAGYVDARGGYNNTGLSKSALDGDRVFFEDKYGKGAYDAYLEKLKAHPEFFANGGAFGGWVPEQPLHSWRTTEKWGDNDINNKNADPKIVAVNVTMENFMDSKCGKDSLTADEQSLMLEVFDKVTTTGRIFGVDGDKAVWNSKLRANDDCDTPSTRIIEPTDRAVAGPWGMMMPRIFAKDLPITVNEGQGEVWVNTYVTQTEVPSQAISAQYEQSNVKSDGKVTDTKVKKQVSVDKVVKGVHVNPKKKIKVQKTTLADVRKAHGRV